MIRRALQAFFKGFPFPARAAFHWAFGASGATGRERDYGRLVGDGGDNSIVSACIQWMARSFPEAPPALWSIDAGGIRSRILADSQSPRGVYSLVRLLKHPTITQEMPRGHYSGVLLWMATLQSWVLDGNAYWLKMRSAIGRVVQLWYVPHWMIEPRWPGDGSTYISHYDYTVDGHTIPVPVTEIVHFRHGLDANNTRKGQSPLHAVLREIFTDEEAARFSASILKNLGVPGVVISPATQGAGEKMWRPGDGDIDAMKAKWKEDYSGDNRGDPIFLSRPSSVSQFGFSPRDLDLTAIRDVPEERISAALGLPAAVIGFGAGLRYTKVGATMAELRDQAWQSNLLPTQRLMAEEIATQLLPDFTSEIDNIEFGFDLSKVKILQEDQGNRAERHARLVSAGIEKINEARAEFDLPAVPEGDAFAPQPGVQNAGSSPSGDGGGNNKPNTTADLQQQIQDLQDQLAQAQKSGKSAEKPVVTASRSGKSAPDGINLTINVPERQLTLAPNIDAHTEVLMPKPEPPGAVEITRDANGRVTGARQV